MPGCTGVRVGLGVGVMTAVDAPGVALGAVLGVGVDAGTGSDFGAGVAGALVSASGFGFILVIKNDNFAPVPLGSHSMKL